MEKLRLQEGPRRPKTLSSGACLPGNDYPKQAFEHDGCELIFHVAVAFWNMIGTGLFGFMINPPIALYYMQGLPNRLQAYLLADDKDRRIDVGPIGVWAMP